MNKQDGVTAGEGRKLVADWAKTWFIMKIVWSSEVLRKETQLSWMVWSLKAADVGKSCLCTYQSCLDEAISFFSEAVHDFPGSTHEILQHKWMYH